MTVSWRTSVDIITAVGNSDALRIVPKLPPTLGMPILNKIGGTSEPKNPVRRPYMNSPSVSALFIRNTGGNEIKISNDAPVVIIALL